MNKTTSLRVLQPKGSERRNLDRRSGTNIETAAAAVRPRSVNTRWRFRSAKKIAAAVLLLCLPLLLPAAKTAPAKQPDEIFTDIAVGSGLDFVNFNGMSGEYYFVEMTGQGGGFVDFDNDGDLDVYLCQGRMLGPGKTLKDATFPPTDPDPRDRLFRNDLERDAEGNPVVHFTDVTDSVGLKNREYGMGVTAADFDNDGWVDLYVTNFGPNKLFLNKGGKKFVDVTETSGTGDPHWGASALAFDYDRDGLLDLYVTNYVVCDIVENRKCFAKSSQRDYCGPAAYPPQRDRFYHNLGGGRFEEVLEKVLQDYKPGAGLNVIEVDVNEDGWLDFYVANDGTANQLWINDKGKSFIDDGLFSGTAVNQDGQAEASMGVDSVDFDADGDEDFFVTHLMGETNTLYVNDGTGLFEDRTISAGLSSGSFPFTTFGNKWVDYDNDGWPDLFAASGAVTIIENLVMEKDPYPLHQPNQLFHSQGGKKFVDVSEAGGKDVRVSEVSRGIAIGDVDNDGDSDILVCNNNGPVRLLRNNVGQDRKWLGLRLMDAEGKRVLTGTMAGLKRKGRPALWRRVRVSGGYCSSSDPRLLFGLGDGETVDAVEIRWEDGTTETWSKPESMKYTTIRKGSLSKAEKKESPGKEAPR